MAMWLRRTASISKTVDLQEHGRRRCLGGHDRRGHGRGRGILGALRRDTLKALPGSKVLADSKDPYWTKQALIADAVFMNADFSPSGTTWRSKTMKALYDAIAWWKKNAAEGNAIIAKGMDMKLPDVDSSSARTERGLDGGLYVYDFMETARFCGVAPGEPPFQQTNGQMKDHFALLNTWWKRFGLIKSRFPTRRASTADCWGSSTGVDIAVDLRPRQEIGAATAAGSKERASGTGNGPAGRAAPPPSWSSATSPRPYMLNHRRRTRSSPSTIKSSKRSRKTDRHPASVPRLREVDAAPHHEAGLERRVEGEVLARRAILSSAARSCGMSVPQATHAYLFPRLTVAQKM